MKLPSKYQWLGLEEAPRHLLKAIELYGTSEIVGPNHNPVIMGWAKELGISYYKDDETPWCGLFTAIVIKRAERVPVKDPLRALSWANFGVQVKEPMLGDILTFKRNTGGHVGFYVGEDATAYHVLGGNQDNQVSVSRIAKSRLYQARRPEYKSQPLNIRKVELGSTGELSTNEA
jgi:uncharacterized protein (TIGR02594 family)